MISAGATSVKATKRLDLRRAVSHQMTPIIKGCTAQRPGKRMIKDNGHFSCARSRWLHCARCKRHSGWLSHETAKFLSAVVEHFDWPTAPVCVRVQHASATTPSASTIPYISAEDPPEKFRHIQMR
jgi:hypothetical protein